MASSSTVTLVGNLTRDPEIRYTTGGRAVTNFSLAVSRRWQQNGEWQEATSFFNVVCWGDLGENVAASLTKGARALVSGRLEQRSWEKDGEKRSAVEVVADEVGASLRWATAEIARTERQSGEGAGNHGRQQSGSDAGYGGGDYPYPDEEPF